MTDRGPVLISWVAMNNDPYERSFTGGSYKADETGNFIKGPALTILFDDSSPYCGLVHDVVLLRMDRVTTNDKTSSKVTNELKAEILKQRAGINISTHIFIGDDPTDHNAIFDFLRNTIPKIRKKYAKRELIIHISPGTPSMQTIWVLMGETGFLDEPFNLVKSYRSRDRHGRPAVVLVKLGIDTFLKVYKSSEPRDIGSDDQGIVWDPREFRTKSMLKLFTEARRFAQIKVPVLLLGERGTGKTTIARWIRGNSPFRQKSLDKKWPAVACGQYSSELLGSELFGHVKGAFTGADKDKDGLIAIANKDTLFLDEIGDLNSENQRKLIKAVEENIFYRLGESQPRNSGFRLLSATNLDTNELNKRLDPDFLDRISLLTLRLPPLREIKDELDWLWPSAFEAATSRAGLHRNQVELEIRYHKHIIERLKQHPLPGNMRDLFRLAYRVLAAGSDTYEPMPQKDAVEYGLEALSGINKGQIGINIQQQTSPAHVQQNTGEAQKNNHRDSVFTISNLNNEQVLNQPFTAEFNIFNILSKVTLHYFERALKDSGENKSKASRLLGFQNATKFRNWQKKFPW
jgi:DNA-binding NtrC family response regulator